MRGLEKQGESVHFHTIGCSMGSIVIGVFHMMEECPLD